MVSGSETVTRTEGQSVALPGAFSKVPYPRAWSNGDDMSAGTLNKEWRDTFNWLLRKTSPSYEGYNSGTPTLTTGTPIPINVDSTLGYGVTHATNNTKVYVWEPGWYWCYVGGAVNVGSVTADSGITTALRRNGAVAATAIATRAIAGSGQQVGMEFLSSVYFNAGDYMEMAIIGSWTGTMTIAGGDPTTPLAMRLNFWWRSN